MLYPKITKSRNVYDLNGIWDFSLLNRDTVFSPRSMKPFADGLSIPVPSSYNDIYEGREFADHVGDMAYKRMFVVNPMMLNERLILRFGSVTHRAEVYINGKLAGTHKGGFLPFEFDITNDVIIGNNLLLVVVNNTVDDTTLPCGRLVREQYPGRDEEIRNYPNFDFYNYTGIMRPVVLYTTPGNYIEDITIVGKMDGSFTWQIKAQGLTEIRIRMHGPDGDVVFEGEGSSGSGRLEAVSLWEPGHPALYTLTVEGRAGDGSLDEYPEIFGFREIAVDGCRLILNGKPLYLKGFGKHEDTPVHGRGFDPVFQVKDIALMKWIGANSFRTSHYPYSEEMMQLCDREGILVIDEAPAVGLHTGFSATGMLSLHPEGTWKTLKTEEHHREVLQELVARDKNHPCVIIWSVANEPASEEEGAREYFEPLMKLTKDMDPQKRPVTVVVYEGSSPESCKIAELCDLLILNRYRGWYDTEGNLAGAAALLKDELERFHKRCPDKPVMLGEYGADTIAGMHDLNARLFSEEYQVEFLKAYSAVFDSLDYITGEHIWNFADFATAENIKRVQGNKKGIFTRDRQPKAAAFYIQRRWREEIGSKEEKR